MRVRHGQVVMMIDVSRTVVRAVEHSRRVRVFVVIADRTNEPGRAKRCLERHRKEQKEQCSAAEHAHRFSLPERCVEAEGQPSPAG